MRIGEEIKISWRGAKDLDAEVRAYDLLRVEALGSDWLVMRDSLGRSYAATFEHCLSVEEMRSRIEELDPNAGE